MLSKKLVTCEKRLEINSNKMLWCGSLCSENTHNFVKIEFTVREFDITNSQPKKKRKVGRAYFKVISSHIPTQSSLCRIVLFKHCWWLTTTCCNWGWSPNLREATKAKLRRSKEKEGGMEAELQGWRKTFTGGCNCLSSYLLLTQSIWTDN